MIDLFGEHLQGVPKKLPFWNSSGTNLYHHHPGEHLEPIWQKVGARLLATDLAAVNLGKS